MKYLCLCYYDMDAFARLSPSDHPSIGAACAPHDERLNATGKVLFVASLADADTWFHLVPTDGSPKYGAGPYQSIKDQAGALFVIEAESAEEAKEVASKHPAANVFGDLGFAVEVRPIEMWDDHR